MVSLSRRQHAQSENADKKPVPSRSLDFARAKHIHGSPIGQKCRSAGSKRDRYAVEWKGSKLP